MKIGTIGSGFIVDHLIAAMNKVDGVEVVACYSRDLNKAKSFAVKNNIDEYYDDLDDLFNSNSVDTIYVASPNSLHYEQTKRALNANKHVIVEKPFSSTYQEALKLVELAKAKNLFLFEAITVIHNPLFKKTKELLSELGPLKIVTLNFSQYSSKYLQFINGGLPNVFNPEFSGGALADINIYNLHFAIGLFGSPNNVNYAANIHDGIDTSGVVTLSYDGFIVSLIGCKDNEGFSSVIIQGEKAYILSEDKPSIYKNFDIINIKENTKENHYNENDDVYYHEIQAMQEIFISKNFEKNNELLDHSLLVMEIFEKARKSANIVFKADK